MSPEAIGLMLSAAGTAAVFVWRASSANSRFLNTDNRLTEVESRMREQLNNMGKKINDLKAENETGYVQLSRDGQRRHHHTSLAIMLIAPESKEGKIMELMKGE